MLHVGLLGEVDGAALPAMEHIALGPIEIGPEEDLRVGGVLVGVASILGVAVLGRGAAAERARFLERWRNAVGGQPPAVLEVADPRAAGSAIASWAAALAAERVAALATANASLRRQLTVVRQDLETLQTAARRLERFITEAAIGDFVSICTSPATAARFRVTPELGEIVQALPVPPFGLAGVDLFIDASRSDRNGVVQVTLRGRDTERAYASWRVLVGGVADGWSTFSLPAGLSATVDHLEIAIRSESGVIELGAGPEHPVEAMTAHLGGRPGARSLAFKAWQGLPLVPPPVLAGGFQAAESAGGRTTIPAAALLGGRAFGPDGAPLEDPEAYIATDAKQRLTLKPTEDGCLAYVIDEVLPLETASAYVTVAATSPAASGVEVAVAATPSSRVGERGWLDGLEFVEITSRRPERIEAPVAARGRPSALVIAVRTKDPDEIWFADTLVVAAEVELARAGASATRRKLGAVAS